MAVRAIPVKNDRGAYAFFPGSRGTFLATLLNHGVYMTGDRIETVADVEPLAGWGPWEYAVTVADVQYTARVFIGRDNPATDTWPTIIADAIKQYTEGVTA